MTMTVETTLNGAEVQRIRAKYWTVVLGDTLSEKSYDPIYVAGHKGLTLNPEEASRFPSREEALMHLVLVLGTYLEHNHTVLGRYHPHDWTPRVEYCV